MTNAKRLLILLASINMLNYIDRYLVPAVLVQMGGELQLSGAQSGSLMSVFFIVYMLTSPLFGYLGDRYSRPKLVAFGIALWSLATAGAALAVGYKSLIFTRALVGVGEAAYVTLGPAMLSDVYAEKDRAKVFTWFYLAIPVGSALGYALGGFMASHWGWRSAFLIAGIPGLIFAWRMSLRQDPPRGAMDESPDPGKDLSYLSRLKLIFTNRVWLAATVCYIGYTFALGGLSTWSPALMQLRYKLTESDSGMIFGALAVITGILGTFAGGKLTDLLQKRWHDAGLWLSGLTLLMAVPVIYFGINAVDKNSAIVLYFAGMLLLFVNTSPVNTIIVSSVPASLRSSGVALNVLLIHLLGDALSPYWVGHRMDVFEKQGMIKGAALTNALEIVLPSLVLGGLALWWARHREPKS